MLTDFLTPVPARADLLAHMGWLCPRDLISVVSWREHDKGPPLNPIWATSVTLEPLLVERQLIVPKSPVRVVNCAATTITSTRSPNWSPCDPLCLNMGGNPHGISMAHNACPGDTPRANAVSASNGATTGIELAAKLLLSAARSGQRSAES